MKARRTPLPPGEVGAKRRVRVAVAANPEPSPAVFFLMLALSGSRFAAATSPSGRGLTVVLVRNRKNAFPVKHEHEQPRLRRRIRGRRVGSSRRSCRCGRCASLSGLCLSSGACKIGRQWFSPATRTDGGAGCGRSATTTAAEAGDRSCAAHECNVLLSIEHERDRRSHSAALAGLDFKKFFAFIGGVGQQPSIVNNLQHEVARSRHGSAADAASAGRSPSFFLSHRIPCDEHSALAFRRSWSDSG